jgi:hypothetical protein
MKMQNLAAKLARLSASRPCGILLSDCIMPAAHGRTIRGCSDASQGELDCLASARTRGRSAEGGRA